MDPECRRHTLAGACERLARQAVPGGLVVCGFGFDAAHLPPACPVTPLADVEAALNAAGLEPVDRSGSWAGEVLNPPGGYVVTVDRRSTER